MVSVGLTGGIGSGKSTVAELFAARGAAIIDTDVIAHRVTAPQGLAMPAILAEFGETFVTAAGALDRAKMRSLIFSDDTARQRLEAIIHPVIRRETERERAAASGPYQMVVVPLLVESGEWRQRVDRILTVDCTVETQIGRVMRRNGFAREHVLAIIAKQASRDARLAVADDVIVNDDDASLDTLTAQVESLHRQYLDLASAATGD